MLKNFYIYQKERFPFAVLIFTTLSVVLSSSVIVLTPNDSFLNHFPEIIIGTITGLLFMFHIRVSDDIKDKGFDTEFHKERPIQRGVISLTELNLLNTIGLAIQSILNVLYSVCAFIFWLIAFGYSLIARFDFFMKRWIRKKFFLYNALNLLQLFFLQIYLYALIEPGFSWRNHLLLVHFIFVLLNASIIEVARKLKRKKEETAARDTYSARLGIGSASLLYSILYISSYLMFIHMLSNLGASPALFYISLVPLSLIILTTMVYLLHAKKSTSKIVEGTALIFYLSMHLLLVFTAL